MRRKSKFTPATLLIVTLLTGPAVWSGIFDDLMAAAKERGGGAKWNRIVDGLNPLYYQASVLAAQGLEFVTAEDQLIYITPAPAYSDGDTFRAPGDYTAKLAAGKIVLLDLGADGVKFNTVASSSFAAGVTTCNLTTANLTANLTRVAVFATRNGRGPWGDGRILTRDYGTGVAALQAAKELEGKISVEVIDPRTLEPLDLETILKSVKKTGRVVIADEDTERCGFGGELGFQIMENTFDSLEAPIKRVCAANYPIAGGYLEQHILPNPAKIKAAVEQVARF